ncbi:MAG: hypothetical protein AB7O48_12270 [Cyclobacteriaceae bacterium]
MGATKKIAIGLGLAGGAILTAWLLSGSRGRKTKDYLVKRADDLRKTLKKDKNSNDGADVHYI